MSEDTVNVRYLVTDVEESVTFIQLILDSH